MHHLSLLVSFHGFHALLVCNATRSNCGQGKQFLTRKKITFVERNVFIDISQLWGSVDGRCMGTRSSLLNCSCFKLDVGWSRSHDRCCVRDRGHMIDIR